MVYWNAKQHNNQLLPPELQNIIFTRYEEFDGISFPIYIIADDNTKSGPLKLYNLGRGIKMEIVCVGPLEYLPDFRNKFMHGNILPYNKWWQIENKIGYDEYIYHSYWFFELTAFLDIVLPLLKEHYMLRNFYNEKKQLDSTNPQMARIECTRCIYYERIKLETGAKTSFHNCKRFGFDVFGKHEYVQDDKETDFIWTARHDKCSEFTLADINAYKFFPNSQYAENLNGIIIEKEIES